MATFTSSQVGSGVSPRAVHVGLNTVVGKYSTSTALSAGDVIQMVKVPLGATVTGVTASGGAYKQYTFTVGDGNSTARYMAATSGGPTAVVTTGTALAGHGYTYTAEDTIDIVTTVATSATGTGTATLIVQYTMDP